MKLILEIETKDTKDIRQAITALQGFLPVNGAPTVDAVASPVPPAPAPVADVPAPPAPPVPTEAVAVPAPPAPVADVPAPPVPTEAVAVPAPPAPTEPAVDGVDLDSEGRPWDGRIHAISKTKLVRGGTWKLKRGIDPALVAQVHAEQDTTPAPVADVPEVPSVPTPPPVADVPEAPTVPTPPPPASAMTFPELMRHTIEAKITFDECEKAAKSIGVDGGIQGIKDNLDKAPEFLKALGIEV
jgi:hypothetical protein